MKTVQTHERRRKSRGESQMASRRESGARLLRTPDQARERQAEETAWAWSRGEKDLARKLGSSPASARRVAESAGEPLPDVLRARFEDGFGAKLGAVRIHRDAAAGHAALREGALAFASGAHIYFGEGVFDADSESGRRLIAHELTHVLQQTGRAGREGIAATDLGASGPVQKADRPEFKELVRLHAPEVENQQYDQVIKDLTAALNGDEDGQPDRVEAYAQANLTKVKDWPAAAESLLYDVLKEVNRLKTAADLLERDDFAGAVRIKTAFADTGIQHVILEDGGNEAFAEGFKKDKDLKAYYDEFLRITEVFIFQPLGSPIPELFHRKPDGTLEKIADHIDRLQDSLLAAKSLSENEWFEGALEIINTLDIERIDQFTRIQHQTDDLLAAGGVPIARKQIYAAAVLNLGRKIGQKKIAVAGTDGGVASVFHQTLGGRIEEIGRKALDDFDRAAAVGEHPEQLGSSPQALPAEALLFKAIREAAARHGMADQLLAEAKELFKPGKDKSWPPPADEYTKRVEKIANDTEKFSRLTLEKRQSAAFHQGKTDEAIALIWLTSWLYLFARALRQGGTDASYDGRLAHQIRSAQALESIAFGLGWNAVLDKVHEVTAAEKQSTSLLALVSDWEEDRSSLEGLIEDVKDQPIRGYEPLRAADLVLFFQKVYIQEVGSALSSLLPGDSKEDRKVAQDAALNSKPLITQAAAKADAATLRPRRFSLQNSAWANKPGAADFSALLGCHPKTVALFGKFQIPKPAGCVCLDPAAGKDEEIAKACAGAGDKNLEAPDGTFPLAPVGYIDPLFIWIVPGIDGLVNTLKAIPLLRDIVASKNPGGANLKAPEWLKALTEYFASATEEDKKKLQDAIRETLRRDKKQAWDTISPNLRRASTIDRRVRARVVTELLKRYSSDRIKHYGDANDAVMRIVVFAGAVVPFEDREVQRAALILSVAPAIIDAFRNEGRYDIVTGLYAPLDAALKMASAPDANSRFAPFLEPDELLAAFANGPGLAEVLENLKTQRSNVQRRFGFRALQGSSVLKSLVYASEVKLNERMPAYDGTLFAVTEIRHGFTFHPAYGTPPGPGETGGSSYSPALFLDEADQKPLGLDPSEVLLVVEVGKDASKKRIEVKAGGDAVSLEVLKSLSYAVEYRAFNTGMKELGIIIQKYIELLLDAGEFIPGVGPAIAATRLLQTAAEFYDQGGYQAVKAFFAGEVKATLDRFMGDLTNLVNPENLWVVILFGDARLDNLLAFVSGGGAQENSDSNGEATDTAEASVSPGKFGFVRKVVNAFKRLGLAFAHLVKKINFWVEKPMQDLRAFATTRPILSFVLSFIAEHIFQIFDLAGKVWDAFHEEQDDPEQKKTKTSSLKGELAEQQKDMGERIHGVMEQLGKAQLPEKVIDMDAVVSFIVHKLTFFVGKRLGTKGKIATLILEETGAIGLFSDRIAHEIVGAGADPNVYWRDTIKPAVQDNFNEARKGLVGGINSALAPFEGVFTPVAPPAPIGLGFTSEEFDETKAGPPPAEVQPLPAADLDLRSPAAAPAMGAGAPLDPALRNRFEERFGQDFQHVRMHQGMEGGPMTSAFGADALTSGSHVFLRPGLNPAAGRGEETTRHELMHVIQQTGSRPLGGGASSTPSAGAPGRGLVYDPMLERAAEEASKQQPGRGSMRAIDPGAAAHMGMQPAFDPRISPFTLGRFFRLISTLPEIKKREEAIAKGVVAAYEKEVPDVARAGVAKVVGVLTAIEANVTAKKIKPARVFTNVVPDLSKYLADQKRAAKLTHGAQVIAMESVEDVELPGQAGAKQKKTEKVLKIPRFERELEAYVLAATGIGITLDLKTSGKSESGKELLDSGDPVKEIKIVHIHLPWVDDDFTDLWTKAIQDDGKGWGTWKGLDAKMFQQYKGVLLPLLESKGVAPGVWAFFGDKYQFSDLLKSNVSGILGLGGAQLPADKLPPWREYIKTDATTAQTQPSPIGHVGVRLATYGDDLSQTSQGRESHHLTQYLLPDYFSNRNATQPFDPKKVWPGVKFDAARHVNEISNPDDPGKPIKVNETRGDDRGGKMPAISLASVTHRRGSLHLTPEPDDLNHKAKTSQASAVHNEFRANVGIPELFDKRFDKYMATANQDDVAKTIYVATQRTYKTVRNYMAGQLSANMADLEFEYYKGVALGGAHDLTKNASDAADFKSQLQAVPTAARAHNEKIMKDDLGWDPSK